MNQEIEQKVVDLYQNYVAVKDIRQQMGLCQQTIYNILHKHNIEINRASNKSFKINPILFEQIVKEYYEGLSQKELAIKHNVHYATISFHFNRLNIKRRRKEFALNENYFEKIDSEDKAYILGMLYADGHNRLSAGQVVLSLKDKDVIEKVRDRLYPNKEDKLIKTRDAHWHKIKGKEYWVNPTYIIYISSVKIASDLDKLGCSPGKTLRCTFPDIDKIYLRHFIRGYFDGDGSLSCGQYHQYIGCVSICCTQDFAESMQKILQEILIIKSSIIAASGTDKIVMLRLQGNRVVERFLEWIYKDSNIHMDRKYNKYLEFTGGYNKLNKRRGKAPNKLWEQRDIDLANSGIS